MKFAATVSAFAAFAATVVAQSGDFDPVNLPEKNAKVPAGKPFEVTWDVPDAYKDGTVSIHLIGGDEQGTQVPLADIAAGIPNSDGKFSWDVDASLGAENVYGLIVKWEANPDIFQYSKPFTIVQGEAAAEADETKTISKAYGTKTISLQTQEKETSTSCTPTSIVTPPVEYTYTPTPTPIVTPPVEQTTIVKKPTKSVSKPKETTVVEKPETEPTDVAEVPEPTEVPADSGASSFGASAAALIGAFVVAAFAL